MNCLLHRLQVVTYGFCAQITLAQLMQVQEPPSSGSYIILPLHRGHEDMGRASYLMSIAMQSGQT